MTSDRTVVLEIHESIFKAPVAIRKKTKKHCTVPTAVCGFSSTHQHERQVEEAQSTTLKRVTRTPTCFTDLSENSQLKSVEA